MNAWYLFERPARSIPAAAAIWLGGWVVMLLLDDHLDLANIALVLVLVAAIASVWLSLASAFIANLLAVVAFNYAFVPPRGTLTVDMRQHVMLLVTMFAVSFLVALLMARQRELATRERLHAEQSEQLRAFGERLREADDPRQLGTYLQHLLESLSGGPCTVYYETGAAQEAFVGPASTDEKAGLRICARNHQAMGPGTGRHEEQPGWYLPLRGRGTNLGAVFARLADVQHANTTTLMHVQALCDQMGIALERALAVQGASAAREAAQTQVLRNTLLAAIAHDHRTPLATILGAATALQDQDERLDHAQRARLAATIVDEAGQLIRLTENTLQLARLDAPGLALHRDWESAEDIVGSVLHRLRQRDPGKPVRARIEPEVPLLHCDAILLVQLLENLVDNALKYGGDPASVEILVHADDKQVVLAVRDRGPGVPSHLSEKIFEPFQRGESEGTAPDANARRGAGVGLAVCRAIARVHGGELTLRQRRHGGSAFELRLPLAATPQAPEEAA